MKRILEPAQGSLLVSEPFLADSFFKRSVVLLSEHDKKGTLGFILNKPTDVTVNQAVDNFPEFEAPLYFGGPVETSKASTEPRQSLRNLFAVGDGIIHNHSRATHAHFRIHTHCFEKKLHRRDQHPLA